jgi:hypothetical protein
MPIKLERWKEIPSQSHYWLRASSRGAAGACDASGVRRLRRRRGRRRTRLDPRATIAAGRHSRRGVSGGRFVRRLHRRRTPASAHPRVRLATSARSLLANLARLHELALAVSATDEIAPFQRLVAADSLLADEALRAYVLCAFIHYVSVQGKFSPDLGPSSSATCCS